MVEPSSGAFERVQAAKSRVLELLDGVAPPSVGIVLGSGLSPLAHEIENASIIPYADIPNMPESHVVGHEGRLLVGRLRGVSVACLSGRAHLYEGHSTESAVFGVRLLAALGALRVVLTNAAGGISGACAPGTLMVISDHLNLTGKSPLVGPNDERFGPRFPDLSEAYSKSLRKLALEVATAWKIPVTEGVYAGLLGPAYETPAEIRMLEAMGADAVGMSTVLETIALRHQKIEVIGLSCITNKAAGKSDSHLSHEEVADVAGRTSGHFVTLVSELVASLHKA
jgi:purine-nucleoside phosphorylase